MDELHKFIRKYAIRGDCVCGQCIDRKENPVQPEGHNIDVHFFKVGLDVLGFNNTPELRDSLGKELQQLVSNNKRGIFTTVDLLDGGEHSYLEVGGWIGDQGMALTLMGLGSLLGIWELRTPEIMLGKLCDKATKDMMAGAGMINIIVIPKAPPMYGRETD
jgi:hypothetical protein